MAHTIFILGTDPQQCKELREILQERIADNIVTAHHEDTLQNIKESDTVILTSEEKNTGILYRRLLNKLEEQVHRAELLSDLIRLFSSSVQIDELLDRVVSKSTEVLGDISFIVLSGEDGLIRLESAFSKDQDQLVKMLIATVNHSHEALNGDLLSDVLTRRHPVVISNLQQVNYSGAMRTFVEKYGLVSLVAVPIQTKEVVLGAVMPGTTLDGAMHAAEKILQKVESEDILTSLGYSGPVTVSIGISEYHRGSHFETLVAEADQALYASKRSSKNCAKAFKA